VLSPEAVILYKCDNYYSPEHERGIALDDPALGIDWGIDLATAIISEKDMNNPSFSEADNNFEYML